MLTARLGICNKSLCDLSGYLGVFYWYVTGKSEYIYTGTFSSNDSSTRSWYSYLPNEIWKKYINNTVNMFFLLFIRR